MSSYSQFLWNKTKGSVQHFPLHFQADGAVVKQCPSMILHNLCAAAAQKAQRPLLYVDDI